MAAVAALAVLAGAAAVLPVLWLNAPRHRVSEESSGELEAGMTWGQVITSLQCPPGDYTTGPASGLNANVFDTSEPVGGGVRLWSSDRGSLIVLFEEDGRVHDMAWTQPDRVETFLERLRRNLGL